MELAVRAMGSLLPKLGELLKVEYGLQKGVKKKVETLSRELQAVHDVLREISNNATGPAQRAGQDLGARCQGGILRHGRHRRHIPTAH